MTTNRVGLLGTGLMGTAMAHRLLDQGFAVVAWNRNRDRMRPLAERGAQLAGSPAEVVSSGAQAVITMLTTAEVVLSVVEPVLEEWSAETIWLQMSSVGAAEADRCADVATAHGLTFFDAPVSGSTRPAEEGELTILASGPDSARAQVEPIFAALGSRVQWVGRAGMGSRLKLAANHWMLAMVAALAEAMHLCELMELDQQQFVALLDGGPLGPPYGIEKLGEMRNHEYPAGFPVRLALKDLRLVGEVAQRAGVELPVLDTALARFGGVEHTHPDADLAAVYELEPSSA
jgi:3-hydroxyisobutyrate dehydrogenase